MIRTEAVTEIALRFRSFHLRHHSAPRHPPVLCSHTCVRACVRGLGGVAGLDYNACCASRVAGRRLGWEVARPALARTISAP
jgi:hypothetical protein